MYIKKKKKSFADVNIRILRICYFSEQKDSTKKTLNDLKYRPVIFINDQSLNNDDSAIVAAEDNVVHGHPHINNNIRLYFHAQ